MANTLNLLRDIEILKLFRAANLGLVKASMVTYEAGSFQLLGPRSD
jgi:hypothetical protein